MFIAIEGLDGAGKNSISLELVKLLLQKRIKAVHIDKNDYHFFNGPDNIKQVLINLHNIIMQSPEKNYNYYNKSFWVTIQASWFNLLYQFGVLPHVKNSLVISAGWYYKFISKYIYISELKANGLTRFLVQFQKRI